MFRHATWFVCILAVLAGHVAMPATYTMKKDADSTLKTYKKRRKFSETPEPKTTPQKRLRKKDTKRIFVVHKHDASHLHYDLRLEYNRVLKSWAIPKGPSTTLGVKRLAVPTEDHPLAYADFEGVIPEGHYGAGTVKIWDSGTYYSIKEEGGKPVPLKKSFEDGRLELWFEGKKLKGAFALIRTNMWSSGKEQWLFMKIRDKK